MAFGKELRNLAWGGRLFLGEKVSWAAIITSVDLEVNAAKGTASELP
jgi:hypothetical protein